MLYMLYMIYIKSNVLETFGGKLVSRFGGFDWLIHVNVNIVVYDLYVVYNLYNIIYFYT